MNIVDLLDERGRTYRFHNVDNLALIDGLTPKEKREIMDNIMERCMEYHTPYAGFNGILEGTEIIVTAKRTTRSCPYWKIYFD
jgi:hypothetical protein